MPNNANGGGTRMRLQKNRSPFKLTVIAFLAIALCSLSQQAAAQQGKGVIAGTVTDSYVGFANFTGKATLSAGQTATVNAALDVASRTDQMIVTGERLQGETEAVNIERTADDIVQILPLKVITSLPNTNIADAVGRLPSVTLERDEGEGKYISIRGT